MPKLRPKPPVKIADLPPSLFLMSVFLWRDDRKELVEELKVGTNIVHTLPLLTKEERCLTTLGTLCPST